MERLSEKLKDVLNETIDAISQVEWDIIKAALDCLAAYEETGLEPEEVDQIRKAAEHMMFDSVGDFARYAISNFEDLRKYRKAEQEGRLVVPLCKVGQRVWINGILGVGQCEEHEITSVSVYIGQKTNVWFNAKMVQYRGEARCSFGDDQIGKTVFLTREEAEAALEGGST